MGTFRTKTILRSNRKYIRMNTRKRTIEVECNDVQFKKINKEIEKIVGKKRRYNCHDAYLKTVKELLDTGYSASEILDYIEVQRLASEDKSLPKCSMPIVYAMISKLGYKMGYVKQN